VFISGYKDSSLLDDFPDAELAAGGESLCGPWRGAREGQGTTDEHR